MRAPTGRSDSGGAVTEPERKYVVVAQVPIEDLKHELREAMVDAARLALGEAIRITKRHRELASAPRLFDALLDDLRQCSAGYGFPE